MKYQWQAQNYSIPVEVVGETIAGIEQRLGVCHPKTLVDTARPISSPLHQIFEWDDTLAAESYRVAQARQIINSIRVSFEEGDKPLPAFVHVRIEGAGPGYVQVLRAMSDEGMRAEVLQSVMKTLQALKERYELLDAFKPVWQAVDQVRLPRRRRTTTRRGLVGSSVVG